MSRKAENHKKLFIIEAPNYRYESLESQLTQIENHFQRILSFLKISTSSGKPISIEFNLDIWYPLEIEAKAKQESKDSCVYKITLKAGISYYLWIAQGHWLLMNLTSYLGQKNAKLMIRNIDRCLRSFDSHAKCT